jgi:hypothetical protein
MFEKEDGDYDIPRILKALERCYGQLSALLDKKTMAEEDREGLRHAQTMMVACMGLANVHCDLRARYQRDNENRE